MRTPPRRTIAILLVGLVGVVLWALTVPAALRADAGLTVENTLAGRTPVTVLTPPDAEPGLPAVVVTHGYAGSATLMEPLGRALARTGLLVVLPDLPGHGRNSDPLTEDPARLSTSLAEVVDFLQASPLSPERIALVGHSMGAGASVRLAAGDDRIAATVAISLPSAYPGQPRDLLLLVGSAEPARFTSAAQEQLANGQPGGQFGLTYGDPAAGTALRAQTIDSVEHLTIVWSGATAEATAQWLAGAFGRSAPEVSVDPAPLWLIGMLVGGLLVALPLAHLLLPRVRWPQEPRPRWLLTSASAGAAAVAGALAAWALGPVEDAIPVAVGGYLAVWFAVTGLVGALLGLRLLPWRSTREAGPRPWIGTAAMAAYATVLLLAASRATWAQAAFVGPRWWVAALLAVAFTVYFAGDEWLLPRTSRVRRALHLVLHRLIAVVVLLAAVPLLGAPGVLTLQVPFMVLLFAVLGTVGSLVAHRTTGVLAPALVQAVPLAAIVASSFPLS